MAILKIARMGHPLLRRPAQPVPDPAAPDLRRLIADMIDTMHDAPGVGLAAPQVLSSLRAIVFRVPAGRVSGALGDREVHDGVLINPEIVPLSQDVALGVEGCLSVPGLRGYVPRWTHIRYRGWGLDGGFVDREATGFLARVIQHECDHLNGNLYIDRIHDLRFLGYEAEMTDFRYEDIVAGDTVDHAL